MHVIIPTLWKPPGLLEVLNHYLKANVVERLIVVDNAPTSWPDSTLCLSHPKLLWLPQNRNLYVNPSWNLGMAQVADPGSVVAILNDDIFLPESVLTCLQRHPWKFGDLIGLLPESDASAEETSPITIRPFAYRSDCSIGEQAKGFGSALVLQKISYNIIPDDLQIWFGDDWLLRHARRIYGLRANSIRRQHHVSMEPMRQCSTFRQRLSDDRAAARQLLGIG